VFAVKLPAALLAGGGYLPVLIAFVARIHVHRNDGEINWRALLEDVEYLNQGPAVLATRQADHDAVAVFNQVEVDDCLGGLLGNASLERTAIPHPTIILSVSSDDWR
jgi:hypothetical protein